MQLVHVYVNFPGNAAEAFKFYEKVFGTKILFSQTFGDTAWANAPAAAKDKLMHIQLPITEAVHLMGSDVVEGLGGPVTFGNNFQISIVASDKEEADRVFAALADGGKIAMPLANAPWGPYFGMVKDKFNVNWMVSLTKAV
jgi:PhnB protein